MADYLLTGLDGLLGRLQPLDQKPNHLVFRLGLGHLFHDGQLTLELLQIVVVILGLLLKFRLGATHLTLVCGRSIRRSPCV